MRFFRKSQQDKYRVYQIGKKLEKNETIDPILSLNNPNLETSNNDKLPNDYIHCLISNHVFCSTDNKFEEKKAKFLCKI